MTDGIQSKLKKIGESGCYFLCLCHKAGYTDDSIIELYNTCISKGYIDEDCFVKNGSALASFLFRIPLVCTIEKSKPTNSVFYIEYWFNKNTGLHHFKLPDYDSLKNSRTIREGVIESYRVFRSPSK